MSPILAAYRGWLAEGACSNRAHTLQEGAGSWVSWRLEDLLRGALFHNSATLEVADAVGNIGGEGQLYLGMIGGAWVGLAIGDRLPTFVMIPVVLLVGSLAGALWILLPAFVRSRLGTSEIVTTLLLTYIAAKSPIV